jgi:hypothetical protein
MTFSSFLHWVIFGCDRMSICGRAWERREEYTFWRAWVAVFGHDHCRNSWLYHKLRD